MIKKQKRKKGKNVSSKLGNQVGAEVDAEMVKTDFLGVDTTAMSMSEAGRAWDAIVEADKQCEAILPDEMQVVAHLYNLVFYKQVAYSHSTRMENLVLNIADWFEENASPDLWARFRDSEVAAEVFFLRDVKRQDLADKPIQQIKKRRSRKKESQKWLDNG